VARRLPRDERWALTDSAQDVKSDLLSDNSRKTRISEKWILDSREPALFQKAHISLGTFCLVYCGRATVLSFHLTTA
jgi:hypothetical protein